MESVFILVEKHSSGSLGHGEGSVDYNVLSKYNNTWFYNGDLAPVFSSREKADRFVEDNYTYSKPEVVEFEVK